MAEPKQASLCSFGLTKRLSLFRSVAYLPLVQKLFNVVKVVFVVLKMTLPELGVTGTLLWACHSKIRKSLTEYGHLGIFSESLRKRYRNTLQK